MGFIGCIPRFLRAHGGWVLTALSSIGLVSTVILTAKETPEVNERLEKAEEEKIEAWIDNNTLTREEIWALKDFPDEAYLNLWDKVRIALPVYYPAILSGLATLCCSFGSQIFNVKKQAAMLAAYGSLATQFDQYRKSIRAEYGEEADRKAYIRSQMEVRKLEAEIKKLKEENGPFLYEFAALPGIVIEAKPSQISNAFMHFNRNAHLKGFNTLAELFLFSGIPESLYNVDDASAYGWSEVENEAGYGVIYIDFNLEKVWNENLQRDVYIIDTFVPPYELEVDYGFEGDSFNHIYKDYSPDAAAAYAESIGSNEFMQVPDSWTCWAPSVV